MTFSKSAFRCLLLNNLSMVRTSVVCIVYNNVELGTIRCKRQWSHDGSGHRKGHTTPPNLH